MEYSIAELAQLVVRAAVNRKVTGSIPVLSLGESFPLKPLVKRI